MFRSGRNTNLQIAIIAFVLIFALTCGAPIAQSAPGLGFISPAIGLQGSTVDLTLTGSGFSSQSSISFSNPSIIVQSVRFVSSGILEATVVLSAPPDIYSVRVSDPSGTSVSQWFSIVAGSVNGVSEFEVASFAGVSAMPIEPYKAWVDSGYLYFTELSHSTVSRISLSGGALTTLAGTRDRFGEMDGFGSLAGFGMPAGIWADGNSVYVTDAYFDTVRKISLATNEVTTIAGNHEGPSGTSDGIGATARFRSPNGIWGDGKNLYVCDRLNFTIRKIVIATGEVTTLAGTPQVRGSADGVGSSATFYAPTDIWGNGTYLYVADGSAIRKIDPSTKRVQTIAGEAANPDYSDVVGTSAAFSFIGGIWGDGSNLYIADTGNNVIRKVSLDSNLVSTVAGSQLEPGYLDGVGNKASFRNPADVVGDGYNVYILDSLNGSIRLAMSPSVSQLSFQLQDRSGSSMITSGARQTTQAGYGKVVVDGGNATPSGLALFGYRRDGVLLFEAAVGASKRILNGRIPVEIQGPVTTGMAIANPSSEAVALQFYFTDAAGGNLFSGAASIPPNGQIAAFLDQQPFAPPSNVILKAARTFTFSASSPVGVIALRGFTNERSEFLVTTLPIAGFEDANDTVVFPHFADGGGWKSEIVLVNPTDGTISGTLEFFTQVDPNSPGAGVPLMVNDHSGYRFPYSVPPRSSVRMRTSGSDGSVRTGWARLLPNSEMPAPSGLLVFAFQKNGITISEAGVQALPEASVFRLYAEASGPFNTGESGSIQSGFAISNPGTVAASVKLELLAMDGTPTGLSANRTVPSMGQMALFLNQIPGFENLKTPFRGFLRISGPSMAVTGLRARYNERGDFLFTSTPPVAEGAPASSGDLIFPHFADGGGYTTQFILYGGSVGQNSNGAISFVGQGGESLPLSLRNQ